MATMQVVVIMFGLFPASHPRNPVHETQREVSHACPSEFQHCLAKPTPLYDSHSSLLVASEPFHNVRLLSQLLRLMEPHNTKPQVQNKLVNAMRRLVRLQIKHLLCIEMYACSHPFFFSACFIHTYTHTLDQCSQAPYWAFLSLLGLVSEGSQAPTEIFTHFLVQSLFCPLVAIFHSLTADELCFLSHQLKITLIWKWLTQAEMAIMLHRWRRSPYSHHRSKHEAYYPSRQRPFLGVLLYLSRLKPWPPRRA